MSKVVKGIKTGLKSIGKKIKKVASSKIGKALLIAATIYIGGAALGAWQSPFTSINGALAGGAKASTGAQMAASGQAAGAATGTAAASTGTAINSVGPMASGYLGGTAPAAATAGLDLAALSTVPGVTAGTTAAAAAPAAASTGAAAATSAQKLGSMVGASEATFSAAPQGIISKIMTGVQPGLDFMNKNPLPTAMMLSAAGSAAAPDEIDLIREQQRQVDKDRLRREKNMDIAGININMRPTNTPLMDTSGNQVYNASGIINRAISGGSF